MASKQSPKFCPTAPEIEAAAKLEARTIEQRIKNEAESSRVSALPAPNITCNRVEMLKQAKVAGASLNETPEARQLRKDDILRAHGALLTLHSHNIKRIPVGAEHGCLRMGCFKPGAISSGTTGKGNYYCAEHHRMA